jgi:hypothetical protein
MDKKILPRERSRADYRVIARILQLSHGQTTPKDSLLEKISALYIRKGGSWVLFFEGHPEHSKLLKMVVKAVVKHKEKLHERRRSPQNSWED